MHSESSSTFFSPQTFKNYNIGKPQAPAQPVNQPSKNTTTTQQPAKTTQWYYNRKPISEKPNFDTCPPGDYKVKILDVDPYAKDPETGLHLRGITTEESWLLDNNQDDRKRAKNIFKNYQ